jgi:hypothetical protein
MLRLQDRLQIALGAGMGAQLDSGDVATVCRMIVVLRQLQKETAGNAKVRVNAALAPLNE